MILQLTSRRLHLEKRPLQIEYSPSTRKPNSMATATKHEIIIIIAITRQILHPRNVRLVEDHHVEKATLEQPAKKTPNKTRPLSNLSRFDLSTLTKTIVNPLQHVTWHL